jgi:osmotically inducible protein OsmC
MTISRASATWEGGLKDGKGSFKAASGAFSGQFTFGTRFEGKSGTNPEELIAAAFVSCFTMALSADLEKAGTPVTRVQAEAACTMGSVNGAPTITQLEVKLRGKVPGIDQGAFAKAAAGAKEGCPVARALTGIASITVDAKLE